MKTLFQTAYGEPADVHPPFVRRQPPLRWEVGTSATRIVGVDLNPEYIQQARQCYRGHIPGLELHIGDIQAYEVLFDPVELIYVALVLEYVDAPRSILGSPREILSPPLAGAARDSQTLPDAFLTKNPVDAH